MPSWLELLPALPWLAPFAVIPRLAKLRPNLSDSPTASDGLVSVIIPARNERAVIETVVTSVLASAYRPIEVLVIDDRSTDDTAARVGELARRDPRLRLIAGEELPPGWYGKPWACLQGYRAARGDLLLFTDADTRHAPELLGRAVGALRETGADLLTIAPRQRCETFWERIVMPQIWLLLGVRYHPERVNHSRRPRDVIANGQFILMPRASYEAVGTHEAVRGDVAEDLALAQAVVGRGGRLHFAFAERLMETRMYQGLGALIEGWSKNVYLGGRRSFPEEPVLRALVPVLLALAFCFWLTPPSALVFGVLAGAPAPSAIVATGLGALFWCLICFGMRIPAIYGLGYPLGAAVALYIAARSTVRGRRRVEWRGRTYADPDLS
jgi:chlorobactene glucosyltransferase